MLLVALAMFGVFFFVSLYMQNVLGYSAVQAGAAFLPMTILLIIVVAPIAGRVSDRFGSRGLMTAGMVLLAVPARSTSASSDRTRRSGRSCPALVLGGVRDVDDDDAERRGGDAGGAGREGGGRLGRPQRLPPGRRLDRASR